MMQTSADPKLAIGYKTSRSRRGSIYLTVLLTSLIIATFAMATTLVAYRTQRDRVIHDDSFDLSTGAESAVEFALARIASDANWRTNHVSNQEYGPFAMGKVNLFYRLIDARNNLALGKGRDITIIGIARTPNASCAVSVNATPNGPAFTCVQYSVAVRNQISINGANHWNTDQFFFFNNSATLTGGSSLTGDIFTVGALSTSGSFVRGTPTQTQTPFTFPTIGDLESIYSSLGTTILTTGIPISNNSFVIDKRVISPNSNPFGGGTNSLGIYLIDCGGRDIYISNSRIVGTLLLLNTGDNSQIGVNTAIEPSQPNYPSLIVKGKICFATTLNNFSEASINTNLNPVGTPLYNIANTTLTETYSSNLKGIVYVSDDAIFNGNNELEVDGILIAKRIISTAPGTLRVFYNRLTASSPPPGFLDDTRMRPISGTYRRIPTP